MIYLYSAIIGAASCGVIHALLWAIALRKPVARREMPVVPVEWLDDLASDWREPLSINIPGMIVCGCDRLGRPDCVRAFLDDLGRDLLPMAEPDEVRNLLELAQEEWDRERKISFF